MATYFNLLTVFDVESGARKWIAVNPRNIKDGAGFYVVTETTEIRLVHFVPK